MMVIGVHNVNRIAQGHTHHLAETPGRAWQQVLALLQLLCMLVTLSTHACTALLHLYSDCCKAISNTVRPWLVHTLAKRTGASALIMRTSSSDFIICSSSGGSSSSSSSSSSAAAAIQTASQTSTLAVQQPGTSTLPCCAASCP
jgi:hypothetical protein